MRTELEAADTSILDHSVESVLPGVHEYLSSLHTEVRATRTEVSGLTASCSQASVQKAVKEAVQQCLGPALLPYASLANSLNLMAASLRSGLQVPIAASVEDPSPPNPSPPNPNQPSPPMDVDDDDEAAPSPSPIRLHNVIGHHPKPTYLSMNELFNEYYGLGRFEGKPVCGGFDKLEKVFKTKWRQGFSRGQKKEWSRLTMTIRGINQHIEELGGDSSRALDNLDLVFQEKGGVNHTTSKMVAYMQEQGLLVKGRARGRYAPTNSSAA
jgi:hypothetical protein